MTYDPKLLSKAVQKLENQKTERAKLYEQRRETAYKKLPRVKEIDSELVSIAAEAIRSAFVHGSDPKEMVEAIARRSLALQNERAKLLEGAFLMADYLDERPMCEKCGDTGYVGSSPCTCLKELYREQQRKELSGPLRLGEASFDSFSLEWYSKTPAVSGGASEYEAMSLALHACRLYAKNFSANSGNLLFTGAVGLGKTFLSSCIAKEVSEKGYSVVYDTATDIFSKFENEKFRKAVDEEQTHSEVRRCLECDLLILDDLGTEMTTGFVVSTLYYIINTRLVARKSTIVSTNLSIKDIGERYGSPVSSRIEGEFLTLGFYGRDIRLQKLANTPPKL